ncbi:hypothetical protein Patl1_30607 [Pistacia atlantica]|uniref:Uncharacterized protein n=1 Tax=Pistacia atlantica TaxID=434234 RepID=A0ACC1ABP7_9ROSI|nr:hypothetical protein Patl1_30607 [Pistacia atlantica]
MAKLIKTNGIVKLKVVVKKLQKSRLLSKKWNFYSDDDYEEFRDSTHVPEDVKEGHVAVLAVEEQAAEEYGFDREGALTIPCRPSELEMILAEQYQEAQGDSHSTASSHKWRSGNHMVQSY